MNESAHSDLRDVEMARVQAKRCHFAITDSSNADKRTLAGLGQGDQTNMPMPMLAHANLSAHALEQKFPNLNLSSRFFEIATPGIETMAFDEITVRDAIRLRFS